MIALAEFIAANYTGKVVEVGVGSYTEVAEYLAKFGFEVVATDVRVRKVPENVKFYLDDVSNPNIRIYEGSSLVYSIRPPAELFGHILRVAASVGADCIIKPLYGEYPGGKLVNYKGLSFYVFEFKRRYENDRSGARRFW